MQQIPSGSKNNISEPILTSKIKPLDYNYEFNESFIEDLYKSNSNSNFDSDFESEQSPNPLIFIPYKKY